MQKFARGFMLLGLVLSASAAFATGQSIHSDPAHPERERMSASTRRQAVLDDLDTLLVGPATAYGIATAPRAIHVVGIILCKRDIISLQYGRADAGNPKSPFKPVGISDVSSEYHLIGHSDELSERAAQKACRSIDRNKGYWASGDEYTASLGLSTLKEVAAAARANEVITFDCQSLQDARIEAICASQFLAAADHPSSVRRCSEGIGKTRQDCFSYMLGDYYVTITRVWPSKCCGGPAITVKLEFPDIIV